jgi:hypothetical protein|tara:strand:+ start:47 stop:529 length:483 start_codon:yes stop_codon:yes gene_type:complete
MSNKVELKGKCLCGAVKYKLSEKPLFTQACHCKDCKVLTGSSYVINSSVVENTLSIEGEISSTIKLQAGSGKYVQMFFCNKCGSYIYTDYESAIGRLNVRTKTLEKSEEFPPQAHIFTKDKDEWVNLSNFNNCFEKMYDPKETWPKESLSRIKEYLNIKK